MEIKIIKTAPWQVGAGLKTFTEGQVLSVGEDVPDKIAEDMLRCDYAVKANEMPTIETKATVETDVVDPGIDEKTPEVETKKDKKRKKRKG